jgi:hypothetical protein
LSKTAEKCFHPLKIGIGEKATITEFEALIETLESSSKIESAKFWNTTFQNKSSDSFAKKYKFPAK